MEFRETEKDLRAKDLVIQESMIQFSVFLQENEKKKKKAADKIENEKKETLNKQTEISTKTAQLKQLQLKAKRIEARKTALLKYEDYLDKVRNSTDEFNEISDILFRYETLNKENLKLDRTHRDLEDKLNRKKEQTTKYIKDKSTEIMKLNNEISSKKSELERILDDTNNLKAEAEEISSKRLGKVSELAQILMAIDNIEAKCFGRKGTKSTVRHLLPIETKPKNFDDLNESTRFAKLQLAAIKNYMSDYKEIHKNVQRDDKEVAEFLQKLKDNNELI